MNAVAQLRTPIEPTIEAVQLHAVLESCPQSLAQIAGDRIVFANTAFARRLGFSRSAELHGQSLSALLREADSNPANGPFLGSGGIPLRFSVAPLLVPKPEIVVLIATQSSRSEPTVPPPSGQMEALGRLVGGVAHDFNNLLTGILLYCDLLHRGLEGDGRLTHYVNEMRAAAEQAATLIQQLMEVARKQATEPVALSWNEAIQDLRNLLRRLIGENVQLVCDLGPNLGLVRMRPAQMPQIILNLALNARDAMPDGGKLTVSTRDVEAGGWVDLTVSDSGCGMDEHTRSRLLEPFFTTKPRGQGNGMGLATVRRIAEEQKGVLELESALGRGTRVTVRLPRAFDKDSNQKGNPL